MSENYPRKLSPSISMTQKSWDLYRDTGVSKNWTDNLVLMVLYVFIPLSKLDNVTKYNFVKFDEGKINQYYNQV